MFDKRSLLQSRFGPALLLLLFAVPLSASQWGDPRGYFSDEEVTVTDLGPGVVLTQVETHLAGGDHVVHVVSVDLETPDLEVRSLTGDRFVNQESGQIYRRSRVSQLQADSGALVAINTAFFDIRDTMAPTGLILQDGVINREPQSGRNTFAMTHDGRAHLMTGLGWSATVEHQGADRNLAGVNRPEISSGQINLYLPPWNHNPSNQTNFTDGLSVTEAFVEIDETEPAASFSGRSRITGTVQSIRQNGAQEEIPDGRLVLSGVGQGGTFIGRMSEGDEVEVSWQLSGVPASINWNELKEAASGANVLIQGGQSQSGSGSHWEGLHPRSAIGISQDQRKIVLVQIEGLRVPERSGGMSLDSVIDLMEYMEVYDALEFDGGGSSAIAARVDGSNQLLSQPSDGSERYVPAGLGVFLDFDEPERTEILMRHAEARYSGSWDTASFGSPFEDDYRRAWTTGGNEPTSTATYSPEITVPGRYDIDIWYTDGGNRSSDTPYQVSHADGESGIEYDQRTGGGQWQRLASDVPFASSGDGFVRLGNNADGDVVIADAMRFLLVEPDTTRFEGWRVEHFNEEERSDPEISGETADPDRDGIPNLLEFALGLDPREPNTEALPGPELKTLEGLGGDRYLTLTFTAPSGIQEIEYGVRLSGGLEDWSESAVLHDSTENEDGTTTRTYRDTQPFDASERRFMRLNVSRE